MADKLLAAGEASIGATSKALPTLKGGGFVVKKKRFAIEQIRVILKQSELGTPVADLCRKFGVSEQSFYRWKKMYGGMEPSERAS